VRIGPPPDRRVAVGTVHLWGVPVTPTRRHGIGPLACLLPAGIVRDWPHPGDPPLRGTLYEAIGGRVPASSHMGLGGAAAGDSRVLQRRRPCGFGHRGLGRCDLRHAMHALHITGLRESVSSHPKSSGQSRRARTASAAWRSARFARYGNTVTSAQRQGESPGGLGAGARATTSASRTTVPSSSRHVREPCPRGHAAWAP
jgi:hypothetical protein